MKPRSPGTLTAKFINAIRKGTHYLVSLTRRAIDSMHVVTKRSAQELKFVALFLELPSPIAIPHGTTYAFVLKEILDELRGVRFAPVAGLAPIKNPDGRNLASFRIWQIKKSADNEDAVHSVLEAVLAGGIDPLKIASADSTTKPDEPRSFTSVVEALTIIRGSDEIGLSKALDTCLASFQELLRAYSLSTGHALPLITRELLQPVILFITRPIGTTRWDAPPNLMIVNTNFPGTFLPPLDEEGLKKLNVHLTRLKKRHPMIPYFEARLRARRALMDEGNYQDAVIYSDIAVEVLIDAVLTMLLWEERMTPLDAAHHIFVHQLPWRVEQALALRLRGDWSRKGQGAVAQWASRLEPLRGRVVHAAYRPTLDEAREAVDVATAMSEFIRERLALNAGKYARPAFLVLAKPGLERLGAWTKRLEEVAAMAASQPDWMDDYRKWREGLDPLREALVR